MHNLFIPKIKVNRCQLLYNLPFLVTRKSLKKLLNIILHASNNFYSLRKVDFNDIILHYIEDSH